MRKLKYIIKGLTKSGIHHRLSPDENKRVVLANKIAIVTAIPGIPYAILFQASDNPTLSWFVLPFVLLFLTPIYVNHLRYYTLSKMLLVLFPSFAIMVFSSLLGPEAGIQMVLLSIGAITFIAFPPKQIKRMMITFAIPVITLIVLEIINYNLFLTVRIPDMYLSSLRILSITANFAIIFSALLFYVNSNLRAQEKLKTANTALRSAYEEAKERRLMLEKASQQASFATLTRGIAHEIRNPMGMILSSTELMVDNLDNKKALGEYAEMVKKNIIRLTKITNTMLKFGIDSPTDKSITQVNDILDDLVLMASAQCKSLQIDIEKQLGSLPEILADSNALSQAFLNIILNAIESMTNQERGTLYIRSSLAPFQSSKGRMVSGIKVEIEDTGCGIPSEHLEKILDPFFTTKYQNNGLGLSMVLKTITKHDGNIDIQSSIGKGTCITVYLPIS